MREVRASGGVETIDAERTGSGPPIGDNSRRRGTKHENLAPSAALAVLSLTALARQPSRHSASALPRSGRARPHAGAHLCRAHRLRLDLRQALRYRREAQCRPAARALAIRPPTDGKAVSIKLQPGVKFHDGEILDAEAAKYSLDRQHDVCRATIHQPELSSGGQGGSGGPDDHPHRAEGAPLAAHRPAHRPIRHDGLAKGGEGSRGEMRSEAHCASPYKFVERLQQDRITVERFADYWTRPMSISIASPICRSPIRRCASPICAPGRLDLIERAAGHRHQGDPRQSQAQARDRARASATRA